ncbi:DUF3144 domain-containing protein [Ruegeria atlantica]|uniref:DUF3144 domain-containing protein n=1 Tax=Ruegeria atlantica TaxID=81569 RepID=UPI00147B8E4F|nr:DUF3144 domain-containing protein [Ruegeria atlantica]
MTNKPDDDFFDRADAVINLANTHLEHVGRGKVSASLLYAAARFSSWVSACGFDDSADMKDHKDETIEYFVQEYRKMLTENLDDYIDNFEDYMR